MTRAVARGIWRRRLAACALGALVWTVVADDTAGAAETASAMPKPPMTWAELPRLAALGEFEVAIDGAALRAHPSGEPCVYFETVYGEKAPGGWVRLVVGGASDEPLQLQTPLGTIVLPPNRLRLHVAPSYSQVFTPSRAYLAPAMVYDDLQATGRPLTVETYLLTADRPYHARVDLAQATTSTANQPVVLVISDRPFIDGQPTLPPAPRSDARNLPVTGQE